MNDEELLKRIEEASRKGAEKGSARSIRRSNLLSVCAPIIAVLILAIILIPKFNSVNDKLSTIFTLEESVENHDLTLENQGIFGYTVADFEDAILGKSEGSAKLEVFKQDISDLASIKDTGLFKIGAFTKTQYLTYHGTVIYTVDLNVLSKDDIKVDEENCIVTLTIPHVVQEKINIPEDEIEFGDVDRGLLAFGQIKLTLEQQQEVQNTARSKMENKLKLDHVEENADEFAKLSVWKIYQPLIKNVARNYSLEVEFRQ